MPRLILHPGTPEETVVELAEGSKVIGRTQECEIGILDKTISRAHARVDVWGDRTFITDLNSRHGTFVNEHRVRAHALRNGESLRCGAVQMRFEADDVKVEVQTDPVVSPTVTRVAEFEASSLSVSDLARPKHGGAVAAEQRLQIMLKVTQTLSTPDGIEDTLGRILDLSFQIFDLDRASIVLVDRETGAKRVGATKTKADAEPTDDESQYSRQIVDWVYERGMAALFSDTQADPRLQASDSVMLQSIRTSMCAPLKTTKETIGVLYVDNLTIPDRFSPSDLELLTAFAGQAALALQNSRLAAQLEAEAVRRNNLLRYFPPSVLERINEESEVSLGARETEVTALFCDISGFTSMASKMTPTAVVDLLNHYFPVMSDTVFRHEGTLEKYIGDALLAVWGAPFSHDDDVQRALTAAIEMQERIELLRQEVSTGPKIEIHIGMATGLVAAGNVGSRDYIQYVTIGDTTNMASRICDQATAGQILVCSRTKERLGDSAPPLVSLGSRKVKGKTEPLELFSVAWSKEV